MCKEVKFEHILVISDVMYVCLVEGKLNLNHLVSNFTNVILGCWLTLHALSLFGLNGGLNVYYFFWVLLDQRKTQTLLYSN